MQCPEDHESGNVEIVQHEQRKVIAPQISSMSCLAAVTDTPLVEMIIRS